MNAAMPLPDASQSATLPPFHPMKISANLAMSLDGKIASVGHCPSGWTSTDDKQRLQELRCQADALIVGHGTLRRDRMTLTSPCTDHHPLRCVVSRHGAFDPQSPLFHRAGGPIHLLVTEPATAPLVVPAAAQLHHGNLADFLSHLSTQLGVKHLHCEGGGELMQALFLLDAIDTLHLTWAGHRIFAGEFAPTISGSTAGNWLSARQFELKSWETLPCGEAFLTYKRNRIERTECTDAISTEKFTNDHQQQSPAHPI